MGGRRLGLSGAEAEAYAKEVVIADFEEAGDDDVFRKIRADFDVKGVKLSDQEIRGQMHDAAGAGRCRGQSLRLITHLCPYAAWALRLAREYPCGAKGLFS